MENQWNTRAIFHKGFAVQHKYKITHVFSHDGD